MRAVRNGLFVVPVSVPELDKRVTTSKAEMNEWVLCGVVVGLFSFVSFGLRCSSLKKRVSSRPRS